MKLHTILVAIALLTGFSSLAHTHKTDFRLDNVTVYLTGAELNYKAKTSVVKGRNTITFSTISQKLVENSIRVKMENNIKIISVSMQNIKVNFEKEIKTKDDSVTLLDNMIERVKMELVSLSLEKRILTDNISRIGSNNNVPVAELMNATTLFRQKLKELDDIEYKLNKEVAKLVGLQVHLNNDKKKLFAEQSLSMNGTNARQLVIEVESSVTAPDATIQMSYLVSDAGWSPKYNIRAQTDAANVELEYRANVYNNSGINWKNVNITLSTASTENKLIKPELGSAWLLSTSSRVDKNATGEGLLNNKQLKNDKVELVSIDAPELTLYMPLTVEYDIPSDNEPHLVGVGDFKLPTRYKYYTVPKVDDNVYLISYISGWQKLNLIEGETSIYYNGAFLGDATLSTRYSNSELEVSLGFEKGIQITKVKKEDKEAEKTIGTNRTAHMMYDIDVRNNKNKDIEIEIVDQVPVSGDDDINVEIQNISGATMDQQNGKLSWNLKMKPAQYQKLSIEFTVKYPRDKDFSINFSVLRLGPQKVICPKFR